jgi:hypothetical protein
VKRSPLKRRRSRIAVRPLTEAEADRRWAVRAQVYARDRYRCLLERAGEGPCSGLLTPHHLRKAGQGGPYTVENLVALCARHNSWVEDEPLRAHELGLVIRAGEDGHQAAARRAMIRPVA